MNVQRDPETILAEWLDQGPTDLPDQTRRAILAALPTTTQARRGAFAPWRAFRMNIHVRLATAAFVVVAIGGMLYLVGPRLGVGGPSASPPIQPSPSLRPLLAGVITLTETGCSWASNPGSLRGDDGLSIAFANLTDRHADFQVHWVRPGHTFAEAVAFVTDLARRLSTGEDWPPNEISMAVASHAGPARSHAVATWPTSGEGEGPAPEFQQGSRWYWQTGTYGVVCSASTSATGDVLSTSLVGPLDIAVVQGAVIPPPGPETADWVTFSSSRHGYELRHPPDGEVKPASAPLTFEFLRGNLGGSRRFTEWGAYDAIHVMTRQTPRGGGSATLGAASMRIPDGMSEDEWLTTYGLTTYGPLGQCVPPRDQWTPITIDGIAGGIYWSECRYAEAVAFVAGRAYTFTVTGGMGGVEAQDFRHLLETLSTVTFHPELADDSP